MGHNRRTDDLALVVGRRDVGDLLHRGDDRLLEGRLWVLAVVHQVEPIGNQARLERLAVTRGQRRAELALVAVGGFVQVDVQHELALVRRDQFDDGGRFAGRAVGAEVAVRVDRIEVPAVDALEAPRIHARRHQQVGLAGIVGGVLFEELQRAHHAAGLIAVHATGDQGSRQRRVPVAAAQGEQGVGLARVVELAVGHLVKARSQRLDARQHLFVIATQALLAATPRLPLRRSPRLARGSDGVESSLGHGGSQRVRKQSPTLPPGHRHEPEAHSNSEWNQQ